MDVSVKTETEPSGLCDDEQALIGNISNAKKARNTKKLQKLYNLVTSIDTKNNLCYNVIVFGRDIFFDPGKKVFSDL